MDPQESATYSFYWKSVKGIGRLLVIGQHYSQTYKLEITFFNIQTSNTSTKLTLIANVTFKNFVQA